MNIKKPMQQLLDKPVNRKEFLSHLGTGLLAVVGITGFVKALTDPHETKSSLQASGYGASSYGGGDRPGSSPTQQKG